MFPQIFDFNMICNSISTKTPNMANFGYTYTYLSVPKGTLLNFQIVFYEHQAYKCKKTTYSEASFRFWILSTALQLLHYVLTAGLPAAHLAYGKSLEFRIVPECSSRYCTADVNRPCPSSLSTQIAGTDHPMFNVRVFRYLYSWLNRYLYLPWGCIHRPVSFPNTFQASPPATLPSHTADGTQTASLGWPCWRSWRDCLQECLLFYRRHWFARAKWHRHGRRHRGGGTGARPPQNPNLHSENYEWFRIL